MTINKFVSWTSTEDETVIVNSLTQKCLILDNTGKIIWESILLGNDIQKTATLCIAQFPESDSNIINHDIQEFYQLLIDNDILQDDEQVCAL